MLFLSQIFQDTDGAYSSKRTAFFIFIALFAALSGLVLFDAVPASSVDYAKTTQANIVDLLKFVGAYIVAEQASKFAPQKKADE